MSNEVTELTRQSSLAEFLKKETKLSNQNIYAHNHSYIPMERWYTLIAGFSGNFVRESFHKYDIRENQIVLDPFVGTGTSTLISMFEGIKSIGIDINPFNNLVAKVKTSYDIDHVLLKQYSNQLREKLSPLAKGEHEFVWEEVPVIKIKNHLANIWKSRKASKNREDESVPQMPHLEKWMSPRVLNRVVELKNVIRNTEINSQSVVDFFNVAFASILLKVSNMQLAGPKICYQRKKGKRILCIDAPVITLFLDKLETMVNDLQHFDKKQKLPSPKLMLGDVRNLESLIDEEIDFAITSPPYLNEVDYLDNTRLELYFLNFVKNDEDIRQLKESMIRANSKYLFNTNRDYPDNIPNLDIFNKILTLCDEIKKEWEKHNWGWDHPRLTAEYFIDMYKHLRGMKEHLQPNAHYLIIVGDSAIDKVLVPTDEILAKIALEIGFSKADVSSFRTRSCSRHGVCLRESLITLTN